MSNNNMKPSNMSIDTVPQWLQAMLELQQQQIADMHATQQHQYEEIQQLSQQGTHAIPISTESNTKALKECLDAPAYFNASDLTLYSSWRMEMLAKLSVDGDSIKAGDQSWENQMKISMLKKTLTFKLLQALVSADKDPTYEGFCTQLQTMNECLIKLKNIQNSGRRYYISVTHTPALRNNNDADAMDWVDSNVYTQARVSAV
ncbi:hypothetical protein BDDG_13408 [Blastomyces dermatitidis ATCC 18188]|uniref:Uncharacterized protein n=1 Tax=Ajellomyces dermatitidis (strain ATCC 18188 / CBS 674.68) TaxID=653446 RepID=A0A0J9ET34_AJEDA|nr:hypothetical protein BDDG_13408 [Blastomyces dermatitidis ATCC 18188]